MACIVIDEKILLLFVYSFANEIPNAEYGIMNSISLIAFIEPITCNDPNNNPLIII